MITSSVSLKGCHEVIISNDSPLQMPSRPFNFAFLNGILTQKEYLERDLKIYLSNLAATLKRITAQL